MHHSEDEGPDTFHIKYREKPVEVESRHTERGPLFLVQLDEIHIMPFKMELDEHGNQIWLENGIATDRANEIGILIEAALL